MPASTPNGAKATSTKPPVLTENPCRSCRRLRSFDLAVKNKIKRSQPRFTRQLLQECIPNVGASMLANAVCHSTLRLTDTASSRAGSLPQGLPSFQECPPQGHPSVGPRWRFFWSQGATVTSPCPLSASAAATNPSAFLRSTNARTYAAPALRPRGTAMAWRIAVNAPSSTR